MYFTECDNYIDGGVLSNNPCDSGLTRLQDYYYQQSHTRLPIACVVSVGSGVCPTETLGSVGKNSYTCILKPVPLFMDICGYNNTDSLYKIYKGSSTVMASPAKAIFRASQYSKYARGIDKRC